MWRDVRPEDVARVWAQIVPAELETHWFDAEQVRGVLRADVDVDRLIDLGVGARGTEVSAHDVWNLGFHDPSRGSRPAMELEFFGRLLQKASVDWVEPRAVRFALAARCPAGAGCSGGEWETPEVVDGTLRMSTTSVGRVRWDGEAVLTGRADTVHSRAVRDVWDDALARLRFQYTPGELARSVDATRRRGAGDCLALALLTVDELTSAGVEAELRIGYMYGGFRMRKHHWVLVEDVDGRRKVLDPSMALIADRYVDRTYREFCCGSRLNRVVELRHGRGSVVRHRCDAGEHVVKLRVP